MSSDDRRIILEHFDEKFAMLAENMDTMIDKKLAPVKEDISVIKDDIRVIKAAVKETNLDLARLEQRVTKLENA